MLKNLVFATLFFVAGVSGAFADEASKKAKIKRYLEVVGLQEMFASQAANQKEQSEKLANEIYASVFPSDNQLTPEQKQKIHDATMNYMKTCRDAFTPERLATTYGNIYGAHLTEAELDGIIAHYESPIGKKEVAASKLALTEYTKALGKEGDEVMKKAVGAYAAELKKIIGNPCCNHGH